MKITDPYDLCRYPSIKMPKLEGRVRAVLIDKKTGRIDKEVRGHNVVTNAVSDIFSHNLLGGISTPAMLPLYQTWYGGILGYKQAHADDTDPTDYFIKGNDVQELIGFAGDENPSTAQLAEDKRRGRKIAESVGSNFYEQTFEWGSEEGNGVWSAVSLCHKDLGNASTGSTASKFRSFSPYQFIGNLDSVVSGVIAPDSNIFTQYDDTHCLSLHIGEDSDYYAGNTTFATKKLTIKIRRMPYNNIGLADTQNVRTAGERVFVIETSNITFYLNPSFYFDYTNKRLWVFNNLTKVAPSYGDSSFGYRNDTMEYAIIDCEQETILEEHYYGGTGSNAPISSDTTNLAPSCMQTWMNTSYGSTISIFSYMNYIIDDGYIYLPTTSGISAGTRSSLCAYNVNGFKKIKLSDMSSQSQISFNDAIAQVNPSTRAGGLIIFGGRVLNGDTVYTCNQQLQQMTFGSVCGGYILNEPNSILSLATPLGCGSSTGNLSRYLAANKMVNTTIYNLKDAQQQPTSFTKDNTKLLQITYTLTEVSS